MNQNLKRLSAVIALKFGMSLVAGAALASDCSTEAASNCSDEQLCFAINAQEFGNDADRNAIRTSIVVKGPEMNPTYTACFGSAILSGIEVGGADRFARRAVAAFDDAYVAENCVSSGSITQAMAYYQDQFPKASEIPNVINEAVQRQLICPGR